jgi:hypothetical protein
MSTGVAPGIPPDLNDLTAGHQVDLARVVAVDEGAERRTRSRPLFDASTTPWAGRTRSRMSLFATAA